MVCLLFITLTGELFDLLTQNLCKRCSSGLVQMCYGDLDF